MDPMIWWYVARAGGMIAWALLAASVLWGLALSTRLLGDRPRAAWLLDLHRFLGGTALVFAALHVGSLIADSYVEFGAVDVLVPFATTTYRPTAVAWGIVSMYLLVAVQVTSSLRRHLSRRTWRRVHLASFPLFGVATLHGLTAGTDSTGSWFRLVTAGVSALVLGMTVASIDLHRSKRSDPERIERRPGEWPTPRIPGDPLIGIGATPSQLSRHHPTTTGVSR